MGIDVYIFFIINFHFLPKFRWKSLMISKYTYNIDLSSASAWIYNSISRHISVLWTIWKLRNECIFLNESDLCVILVFGSHYGVVVTRLKLDQCVMLFLLTWTRIWTNLQKSHNDGIKRCTRIHFFLRYDIKDVIMCAWESKWRSYIEYKR